MNKPLFFWLLACLSVGCLRVSGQCTAINSYPYTETFDPGSPQESCWTVLDVNADGVTSPSVRYIWDLNNTFAPRSGTQAAVFYSDGTSTAHSSNDDWLISPALVLNGNQQMNFFVRTQTGAAGDIDQLEVLLSTTGKATANFTTTLLANTSIANITYQQYTLDLSAYSGTVYVAFVRRLPPVDGYRMYIDDVTFENKASCVAPSALTVGSISSTGASLNWTQIGTPTSYQVEVVTKGTAPTGTATQTSATKPVTVSGLTQNTAYDYYARANCTGGLNSIWTGPFSSTTSCGPISTFPYTETFDPGSTREACWTVLDVNGDGQPDKRYTWNLDNTLAPRSGPQAAVLYTDVATSNNDWLISPAVTLTGNQQINFYVRAESATEPDQLEVLLSTTGTLPANFTTTLLANTPISNTGYQQYTLDLSAYSGTVYVAFVRRLPPADGYRLYLDDVTFETRPACVAPSALSAGSITGTGASLNWTQTGTPTSYQIEVVTKGTAPTGIATQTSATKPVTVNGLTQNTAYDFYVRAVCSGGSQTSTWTGPASFTTTCGAISTFPYTETFEATSTREACWTVLDVNGDGQPDKRYIWNLDNTLAPRSGTQAAVLYTDLATGNNDWLISPALTLTGNQQVTFYVRGQVASEPDQLEVLLSTTGNAPANFTTTLLASTPIANTTYQLYTLSLGAVSGTAYVAFVRRQAPADGYRLYVDDVTFEDRGPLPVTLTSFRAQTQPDHHTLLTWTTAREVNNDHFRLERARNARQWTTIGQVAGQINSQILQHYQFTDETARRGYNYYRLVQVDTDGAETPSKIESVATEGGIVLRPNPVTGPLYVDGITVPTQVEVFDALGRRRATQTLDADGTLDLSGLTAGVYVVRYHDGVVARNQLVLVNP